MTALSAVVPSGLLPPCPRGILPSAAGNALANGKEARMIWVLLAALAGGISVVLQAQSARAEGHPGHLGLLATLVRRPR
jgi:hypothetical protein